jgi:hypothetical protein
MQSGRQFEYEVILDSELDSNLAIPNWIGSSGRADMPSGFPVLYLYRRRMAGGESVWILMTSTEPHRRMNNQWLFRKR